MDKDTVRKSLTESVSITYDLESISTYSALIDARNRRRGRKSCALFGETLSLQKTLVKESSHAGKIFLRYDCASPLEHPAYKAAILPACEDSRGASCKVAPSNGPGVGSPCLGGALQ